MTQEIVTRDPVRELVAQVRGDVFREQAAAALPPDVPVEKFVRITATALLQNPDIAKLEQRSLFNALLQAASMGLMPDAKEAAVVPFKGKAQLIPMIGGFRKIAAEYGWALRARVVYENDTYEYEEGTDPKLFHRPARPGVDRGPMVAVYAVAQHKDGRRLDPVWLYASDVEKIRQTSKQPDGELWSKWTERAWEKTAGRQLFKALPMDEKDRERISRVLDASDLAPGEAATLLYGPPAPEAPAANGERRQIEAGEPEASEQPHAPRADGSASAASDSEADFDEPEPVEGEVVEEASFKAPSGAAVEENPDVLAANAAGTLGFTSGKWKGKTIAEVAASGDDGLGYIEWALRSWKTDPLKSAVWDYAKVFAPDLYQKVMAQRETAT